LTCAALALAGTACTETATPTNTASPSVAASPAAPSPAASVDEFANARANYAKNCEGCHGPEGNGGLVKVDNKQIKVPSLHAEHAIKHTDEEIIDFITNGHEEMPAFKDKMRPEEIIELVRFVRKVHQGK
ncbi:MAG TPA: cytochrome c, partial [Pyrinomonadaceae bacterium]|nr:cytochrome c [Pyrinomonadaceae bacterium]